MGKGGARVGAGRPPSDFTKSLKRLTQESILDVRQRQAFLRNRIAHDQGDDAARKELASLSMRVVELALPHVAPRLQAVVAQTETKVSYVARLPETVETIEAWEAECKKLLPKAN
jgi:hypothetical protein